ncbi:hypothetical protein IAT38_008135 [Cryptococcus sp. DSM 104549]
MAGETSDVRRYDADFKKVAGTLSVTATHIAWVPKAKDAGDRQNQAMDRAINMLASKAGSERVSLKILFKDNVPVNGLTFTFTSATKEDDRKAVQDILVPFVAVNKGAAAAPAAAPTAPTPAPAPTTQAAATIAGMSTTAKGKRKADELLGPGGGSGAASPSTPGTAVGTPSAGPVVSGKGRKRQNALRQRVLEKNDTLRMLHRELVLAKHITEEEFWDGREALIEAEEMAYSQKPGRPSRLLDDRFDLDAGRKGKSTGGTGVGIKQADTNGPIILKLSKELTREIFEEFPVVQDAYAKYVPGISETEFWSRYFTSRLWELHRASVRKTTTDESSQKKDDIFDQYLEDPDWNLEPRQQMPDRDGVERYLDLAATEEDHGEASSFRDVTMQAGRERSALPLIRRFNDHSKKLLRAATGGTSALVETLGGDLGIYGEIDLPDLHGPAAPPTITLDVSSAALASSSTGPSGILPDATPSDLLRALAQTTDPFITWDPDFRTVNLMNPPRAEGEGEGEEGGEVRHKSAEKLAFEKQRDGAVAASAVTKELWTRAGAESAVLPPFPDIIHEQVRSCHNAATEFLRQYWSAILPPQAGTLGGGNAAAREAKAVKMAGYLRNTGAKVEAIVQTAQIAGFDPERVRKSLAPTMGAVHVALEREKVRAAGKKA